ncbi:MAG: tyrosine-type recombinase/integrase [Nitrosotalea sp.]
MQTDLHNSPRRFEKEKENISIFKNGKMGIAFLEAMVTYGISVSRVSTLAWNVKTILAWKDDKPASQWTRKDVEYIINQMQKKDWSSETRDRFAFTIKRFVAYAKTRKVIDLNNGDEYPELVAWIHPAKYRRKTDDNTLENRKGFSEEEVMKIIQTISEITTDGELVSTLILTLYEGGFRTHEGVLLKQKQLTFNHKEGEVIVTVKSGKSPSRIIPLLLSYRPLLDLVSKSPYKDDPDSYVFYSKRSKSGYVSYGHLREFIGKACQKAGIRKRSLYKLRHSRGTNLLLSGVDVKTVSKLLGHSSIETTETYLSVINSDVRTAIRRERGLEPEEKREEKMKIMKCPRCGRIESPLATRCQQCSAFLSQAVALKYERAKERSKKYDNRYIDDVKELRKDYNELKEMLARILNEKEIVI